MVLECGVDVIFFLLISIVITNNQKKNAHGVVTRVQIGRASCRERV